MRPGYGPSDCRPSLWVASSHPEDETQTGRQSFLMPVASTPALVRAQTLPLLTHPTIMPGVPALRHSPAEFSLSRASTSLSPLHPPADTQTQNPDPPRPPPQCQGPNPRSDFKNFLIP
ncbi:hypothetical protein KC19_9G129600 [Ceratodon purpureus]|uniref:Uncharacterized protein n=1 Tax=Ceratodon purpureus TaxID=3225 RepID=A0A8T0GTK1_CERPU|nr:hypothetical protein KC19_9G129600 [Ceratodon purpureus]